MGSQGQNQGKLGGVVLRDTTKERQFEAISELAFKHSQELEVMKVLLDKLDHSLFGNGQPGILKDMQKEIDMLKACYNPEELKQQRDDIRSLMQLKWMLLGSVSAIQVVGTVLQLLLKGGK